jgi:hypothetical protein
VDELLYYKFLIFGKAEVGAWELALTLTLYFLIDKEKGSRPVGYWVLCFDVAFNILPTSYSYKKIEQFTPPSD